MATGTTLHHFALTAADLQESGPFFDTVLGMLGYTRGYASERLITWHGPEPEILLYTAEGEDRTLHQHGRPGLQHLAFAAPDRQSVLDVHKAVVAGGWTVIHEPREYPEYPLPGYFAVFVQDPSGLRIEVLTVSEP